MLTPKPILNPTTGMWELFLGFCGSVLEFDTQEEANDYINQLLEQQTGV